MAGKGKVALYEWVRILATLCVVVGHGHYLVNTSALGGVSYAYPEQACGLFAVLWHFLAEAHGVIYCFHMPLFFVLSGAVLRLRPLGSLDALLAKKARRLLVPYYLVGLLYMFPLEWLGRYYPDGATLRQAVADFQLSTAESGHLWFLPALFWCMLLLAVLVKGLARLGCHSGALCLLGCTALCLLGPALPPAVPDLLGLRLGLQYLPWFALGYVLEPQRPRLEALPTRAAAPLAAASFVLLLVARKGVWPAASKALIGCTCAVLVALLCTRLPARCAQSRLYRLLVQDLFAVYLFHAPLNYPLLRVFFDHALYRFGWCTALYVLARTVGVLVASVLLAEALRAAGRAVRRAVAAR